MATTIHPAAFLAGALALSAAWLGWRALQEQPAPADLAQRAAATAARPEPRAEIRVDPAVLSRYAGTYVVDGLTVVISVERGRLVVDAAQAGRFELVAETERKFVLADFPGEITFDDVDAGELARSFRVDLPNGRSTAKRVEATAR